MLVLAAVMILLSLVALAAALGFVTMPSASIQRRVKVMTAPPETAQRKSLSIDMSRTGAFSRLTPSGMIDKVERNIVLAGRPEGWSRERVLVAKPIGLAVGLLFALGIMTRAGSPFLILVALAAVVLGYFVPDLLIYNRAVKRQLEIQKELPDTLDQIVISIEAGTGFESALARAGEQGTGPLADEIVRLMQDMGLGMSRREAYLALSGRTSVEELQNFCRAIVQAEEYGVSIASVVRLQAREMRLGRKLRAEARAQQVPVKILIPLMLLILPVLFIIVLGPPVVNAYAIN